MSPTRNTKVVTVRIWFGHWQGPNQSDLCWTLEVNGVKADDLNRHIRGETAWDWVGYLAERLDAGKGIFKEYPEVVIPKSYLRIDGGPTSVPFAPVTALLDILGELGYVLASVMKFKSLVMTSRANGHPDDIIWTLRPTTHNGNWVLEVNGMKAQHLNTKIRTNGQQQGWSHWLAKPSENIFTGDNSSLAPHSYARIKHDLFVPVAITTGRGPVELVGQTWISTRQHHQL